jgi:hypothetical protein
MTIARILGLGIVVTFASAVGTAAFDPAYAAPKRSASSQKTSKSTGTGTPMGTAAGFIPGGGVVSAARRAPERRRAPNNSFGQ